MRKRLLGLETRTAATRIIFPRNSYGIIKTEWKKILRNEIEYNIIKMI